MKDHKSLRIFILADDASWHGSMLEQYASLHPDYDVKRFDNAEIFFQQLQDQPDVIALDCPFAGNQCSDTLRRVKSEQPRAQVIIITSKEEAANSSQLLKHGAFDCIVKDESLQDRLWNTLLHLQEIISLRHEVSSLKDRGTPTMHVENGNGVSNGNGLSSLFYKEISLREYECQIIQYYLEKYNKDVLLVAKKLDIGKSTIYRMIQNGELRNGAA